MSWSHACSSCHSSNIVANFTGVQVWPTLVLLALEARAWYAHTTCLLSLFFHSSRGCTLGWRIPALVRFQVAHKIFLPWKFPGTEVALVRSLPSVDARVQVQVALTIEGFGAVFAFEWALACMCYLMSLCNWFVPCNIATHSTHECDLFLGRSQTNRLVRVMTYSSKACNVQNDQYAVNNTVMIQGKDKKAG